MSQCPKFYFDMYFYDADYRTCDDSYDFQFCKIVVFVFQIKIDVIKFTEYSRKYSKSDCTCYKTFKFSMELFGAVTSECI